MKQRRGIQYTMTEARLRVGLTQAELAKLMRTNRSVVVRWETGKKIPTVITLEKLAEVTGHRLQVRLIKRPS
jgi:transcriptional regulator with XRE-family HTH domain